MGIIYPKVITAKSDVRLEMIRDVLAKEKPILIVVKNSAQIVPE
jgi:hypothetical protein